MKKTLTIILLFVMGVAVFAETITILPSDDMYTDVEHPGVTPVVTELWTANFPPSGHFERIMMRFDLNELRTVEINSAVLHLTRFYSCPSGGTTACKFYPISQNWTEDSWPHNVHVEYHESNGMDYVFTGSGGNTIVHFEVDITDLVTLWTSGVIENNGFLIMANRNQKFSKFYSKEHPNELYRPKLTLDYTVTSNDDVVDLPMPLAVTNYPNPFNPETTISMYLPEAGDVRMSIYNTRGQMVYDVRKSGVSRGHHNHVWDAKDNTGSPLSSGIYFCRLESRAGVATRKMILTK